MDLQFGEAPVQFGHIEIFTDTLNQMLPRTSGSGQLRSIPAVSPVEGSVYKLL